MSKPLEIIIKTARQLVEILQEYLRLCQIYRTTEEARKNPFKTYASSRIPDSPMPETLIDKVNAANAQLTCVPNDKDVQPWPLDLNQVISDHLLKLMYPQRYNEKGKRIMVEKRQRNDARLASPNADTMKHEALISYTRWNEAVEAGKLPQPEEEIGMRPFLHLLEMEEVTLKLTLPALPKPEPVGLKHSYQEVTDQTPVMLGFYRSAEQLQLILRQHIYHVREAHYKRLCLKCQNHWPTIILVVPNKKMNCGSANENIAPVYCFEVSPSGPRSVGSEDLLSQYNYQTTDSSDRWIFDIASESDVLTDISMAKIYDKVRTDYQPHLFSIADIERLGIANRVVISQRNVADDAQTGEE